MMTPEQFIVQYETALATQSWNAVAPLIHESATVTFSSGNVYKGHDAIQGAYQTNFNLINNEKYSLENVHWVMIREDFAVYTFDFFWKGIIQGKEASGAGCGTSMLVKENEIWKLIAEHLGSKK